MLQRQGSTLDQLRELYVLANKNGLYDAADVVRNIIESRTEPVRCDHGDKVLRTHAVDQAK